MKKEITFDTYYKQALEACIKGWNFSFLDNRYVAEDLPWDYKKTVENYLKTAKTLLDVDTGGGEFLSDLKALPAHTVATENYGPNLALAAQRLQPLNVRVVECDAAAALPFASRAFDLVINRHGSLNIPEVLRVLPKNGIFITQQVGARNNIKLNHFFGDTSRDAVEWNLAYVVNCFRQHDVEIIKAEEYYPQTVFKDIGAVVYYLRYIPWQIQGFDMAKNIHKLKKLHEHITRNKGFESREHRFLLIVKKR